MFQNPDLVILFYFHFSLVRKEYIIPCLGTTDHIRPPPDTASLPVTITIDLSQKLTFPTTGISYIYISPSVINNQYDCSNHFRSEFSKENSRTRKYFNENTEKSDGQNLTSQDECSGPAASKRYKEQYSSYSHCLPTANNRQSDNILSKHGQRKNHCHEPTKNDSCRHIRKSAINNHTCGGNPFYTEHVARFYQRITDIFETDETQSFTEERKPIKLPSNDDIKKPRPSYRTVLEDVKDLEVKYRKINEEAERSRIKTELDYLRPDNYLQSRHWEFNQVNEDKIIKENIPYDKYHRKKIEYFHETAVNINKEVRTPTTQNYRPTTKRDYYERTRNSNLGSDFPTRFVRFSILLTRSHICTTNYTYCMYLFVTSVPDLMFPNPV